MSMGCSRPFEPRKSRCTEACIASDATCRPFRRPVWMTYVPRMRLGGGAARAVSGRSVAVGGDGAAGCGAGVGGVAAAGCGGAVGCGAGAGAAARSCFGAVGDAGSLTLAAGLSAARRAAVNDGLAQRVSSFQRIIWLRSGSGHGRHATVLGPEWLVLRNPSCTARGRQPRTDREGF